MKSLCVSITLKHFVSWNGAQLFIAYWINFNKLFERCYDLKFKYWMDSNVDMATSYYKSDILHKRPYFPIARKSFSNLNRIITIFTIHTILFFLKRNTYILHQYNYSSHICLGHSQLIIGNQQKWKFLARPGNTKFNMTSIFSFHPLPRIN